MPTNPKPSTTDFTRDVLGRFICNGLDEALRSADKNWRPDRPEARPDARDFDVIIVGGGTFGSALAQHLFHRDGKKAHRILVLEAGPFVLPEHVQNLPPLGLDSAKAEHLATLKALPPDKQAEWSNHVWGLPWHSELKFPGLAYCLGGRSIFWGGWSPQLLEAEMPAPAWPASVVAALKDPYFRQAGAQIGVSETNDFIDGELHKALRQQLHTGLTGGAVPNTVPLGEWPPQVDPPKGATAAQKELLKLEAPLAVHSRESRPGFFPFNKFSAVPLLIQAARQAQKECANDDVKKRLMVVPNIHVKRLVTEQRGDFRRVVAIETNQGYVPVPENGMVVLALATVESTRLAKLSFGDGPDGNPPSASSGYRAWWERIGTNLMAHLRSNVDIRIPRTALAGLDPLVKELQTSALFVKGRHQHADGTVGHFHLQITASGLGKTGTGSEAELFQKVPDIDGFEKFAAADDTHVVITIRGIGEMTPRNPDSHVSLDGGYDRDEFAVRRAFVALPKVHLDSQAGESVQTQKDRALWDTMDNASDEVAKVFAGGKDFEVFTPNGTLKASAASDLKALLPYSYKNHAVPTRQGRRDGPGTTHHETGTLWMGDDPGQSVTDADGRFHHVTNTYAAGPALFPTIGSPNPMLTGIALARRLADTITAAQPVEADFKKLFDGALDGRWQMAGAGQFIKVGDRLESVPGGDLGLLWCTEPAPANFSLKLEWLRWLPDDNSGVFLRFPDPTTKGYNNTAYVGVDFGFEVQIDAKGAPDGAAIHKDGAIYNQPGQMLTQTSARPPGTWNEFEIRAQGQDYTVLLNGTKVSQFQNPHAGRGLPSAPGAPSFIGLQTHGGQSRVAFRKIRIKALAP